MKVEQIQRSDIWNYLQADKIVWRVHFYESLEGKVTKLNDQSINYVNNLISGNDESDLFFRKLDEE